MSKIKIIPVRTWYLEMKVPPQSSPPEFSFEVSIVKAIRPTISFYHYLYNQVGKGYSWYNRLLMFDDELLKIIHNDQVEIFVLWVDGVPAGFCELDMRIPGEVELAYFGIMAEFRGQGLGSRFLKWTLQKAWSHSPSRVWLHTCELDDKAAVPMYLKAGFTQYDERMENQHIMITETGSG